MNDKSVFRIIMVMSVVVFGLIVFLYTLPKAEDIPVWATKLPLLNACMNGTCFVLLLASLAAVKKKNIALHKKLNITAFVLSALFLLSYVTFHSFGVETKFPADNPIRPFYLVILLTHILLAAIVLPLILVSFYFGLTEKIEKHRKIVRFSYPIWLYVTLSGVIVYGMISPYYVF